VTAKRLLIWERYFMLLGNFLPPEKLPIVPSDCQHNGHLFYLILESKLKRELLTRRLLEAGIEAVIHYVPLHNAPIQRGNQSHLPVTECVAKTLLRLPLYYDLSPGEQIHVAEKIREFT
ncbi:MAG TPA: DegT/DnrJ/EryC1/StrS family aminotransferase, partial [Candidatus Cloacimonadota bacterium]|nr:DegT/DnrJ/EryC1/StrS family aminotransferase [Candidatus Cloacimonadota bacterium]